MGILNLGGTTKRHPLSSQAVGREHLFCPFHLSFFDFYADFNLFAALAACGLAAHNTKKRSIRYG